MTENNKNEKKWYKNPFKWGVIVLSVLTVIFLSVMLFDAIEESAGSLLGLTGDTAKNDTLSFIGIAMGGALVALQAIAGYRRAKAMEDAAQHTEHGQRQERFKNAIEHLGHSSDSVRLGAAYELFHLAEDNRELNQTVLDILCAHIRQTTSEEKYQHDYPSKPSEEIQSLLTLLFVREHEVFSGCHINLQASWLKGANFYKARLTKADLSLAKLDKANLNNAKMQAISLLCAKLTHAYLMNAQMQGANLGSAKLMGANLFGTEMQGASLIEANLLVTHLSDTKMQAACFYKAEIETAHFGNTEIQITRFPDIGKTQIQGAKFRQPPSGSDFESIIRNSIDKTDDFDALHFDNIAHKKRILKGIVRGHYTEEEAEKWIAEYNKAMVPFTKK